MHTMQQTANTLPPEAVAMLKKAASTPNTGVGCLNRLIAIEDAAQIHGAYRDVVFDDAAIHAAIADMGGWPKFCRCENDQLSYQQHRFQQSYAAYKAQDGFTYPPKLLGDRMADDLYAKRGLPMPVPSFIGNKDEAKKVLRLGGDAPKTQEQDAIAASVALFYKKETCGK